MVYPGHVKRTVVALRCSIVEGGTECVVNASNSAGALGSGVSRAIANECGGAVLQEEIRERLAEEFDGVLEEGDCLVTSAGTSTRLKHVLHVASVDYRGVKAVEVGGRVVSTVTSADRVRTGTEAALAAATELARAKGTTTSVTFPLLGAGAGGLGPTAAMNAMLGGMRAYFRADPDAPIDRIVFAVPEQDRHELCAAMIASAFGSS